MPYYYNYTLWPEVSNRLNLDVSSTPITIGYIKSSTQESPCIFIDKGSRMDRTEELNDIKCGILKGCNVCHTSFLEISALLDLP